MVARASFGADLEACTGIVLKTDTWVTVVAPGIGVDPQQGEPAGDRPLGISGVDNGVEVRSLYVHPDLFRCGLAHGLANT